MSSSQEAAAAARASTDGGSGQPHQLFDAHLRFLNDSYLGFFLERRKLEEQYYENLQKLHRRYKAIDTYLDDRFDMSTARAAWREVRDGADQEAQSRAAFIQSLTIEIINPLTALKETQERIRKRIREDMKRAVTAHTEYEQDVLPKLKRTYLKKSQDVEDLKSATSGQQLSPTGSNDTSNFPANKPPQGFPPTRPVVTAPQPLKPLDRRPSQTTGPTRNRSPSTSTALQDLAHQGKRQLNQLITFLDKGGNKDVLSGRSDNALRAVRAKREADEADKEYRKAVHWLETLRLRRAKILESAYKGVESLINDIATTVKKVTFSYSDNLLAAGTALNSLSERTRRAVERIDPTRDTAILTLHIPRLLAAAIPGPQYYQNFLVGECRDLIFGVNLVYYATAKGLEDGEIPRIVRLCIKEIEDRGLDAEGIYRVSGRHAAVQELQHKVERDGDEFHFNPRHDDVYAVSSLLKLYLRELPKPVFKFPLQERLAHSEDLEEHRANNFQVLRSKIRRLPPVHQATLAAIVEHLAKVASHQDKNKMDPKNLAIVFGGVIFGDDEMPKGGDLLSVQSLKDTLMEDLINNANTLFQSNASPPLPPAPAGEPVPALSYGSQHTRLAEIPPPLPPRPQSPSVRRTHSLSVSPSPDRKLQGNGATARAGHASTLSSEDFTPQLPPRPTNSIHPSLRAGPLSSQPRQPSHLPTRSAQFFDDDVSYMSIVPQQFTSSLPEIPSSSSSSPSPSKRVARLPLSPPLASPWSDTTQPSMTSAVPFPRAPSSSTPSLSPPDISPVDDAQEIIVPSREALGSGPSSGTSYASAVSPTTSIVSSTEATQPPVTPDMPTKSLTPEDSPNRTSTATILGRKSHTKGASSSSD
ncbi:hypothetical protein BDY19DRAFT_964989 [Irpex rosettiformis]|uniref:Uncharacterized protein n=1 Tax=Irpex rosettiformis TaxID=378272 RepID=A0ACB8TUC1_9APHY|nr:hypothetical protein BDY19DRAFT_964989 [Irpex rosettiformis]